MLVFSSNMQSRRLTFTEGPGEKTSLPVLHYSEIDQEIMFRKAGVSACIRICSAYYDRVSLTVIGEQVEGQRKKLLLQPGP
jgi:hypothetical protein